MTLDILADILDRFNRKERNLLIRDAVGHLPKKTVPLSNDFMERVRGALNEHKSLEDHLEIPADAWWATDYHLNWIAGALALWHAGDKVIDEAQVNDFSGTPVRRLIERNQEDADFLIAFEQTLILIEVKAFGFFTNRQIDSKVQRWRLLKKRAELVEPKLTFHFMLMSRTEPDRLKPPPDDLLPGRSKWPHAVLKVHSPSQKLMVTGRKPGAGPPPLDGKSWFIVGVNPGNDEDEMGDLVTPPLDDRI